MLGALLGIIKANYDLQKAEREMYRELQEEERQRKLFQEQKRIEQEKREKRAGTIAKIIAFIIIIALLGWLGFKMYTHSF